MDSVTPIDPVRRIRYYLGRAEDALDSAADAMRRAPSLDEDWREEFAQDLDVLPGKLDVIRAAIK